MHKKLISSLLSATLILSTSPVFALQIDKPKQFKVDGYVNKQGIEYVKVTDVAKALGLNVKWNPEQKTVTISDKDGNVSTGVPDIVNGKSYLPEGFFNYQNKYKAKFDWSSKNKTMTVNSNNIVNSNNTIASYNNNNNTTTKITNSNIGNTNSFNQNSFNTTMTINVNGGLDKELKDEIKNTPTYTEQQILDAVNNNDWSLLDKALASGQKINLNARDKESGMTLLMFAVVFQDYDRVKMLLDKGANPNVKDNKNSTALHLAALISNINENDYRIAQLLVENGANIESKDDDGKRPFDKAKLGSATYILLQSLTKDA